ncbi:MAG: TIGR03084 family metal-binding protein [Acidimicrobiales bacterium]
MATDLQAIVDDLAAESSVLTDVLERLGPRQWLLETPAQGWTIADQVSHLAYFDGAMRQSVVDPTRFRRDADKILATGDDFPDRIAAQYRGRSGSELLSWFQSERMQLVEAYRQVDPGRRLPWYGPDMSPASSVTARLMETWAHGQDVFDTVGVDRVATRRLRHVAHIGVGALPYSYSVNQLPQPGEPVRVELAAPDGTRWSWGSPDAANSVTGDALEFCLVVTQRRHLGETGLVVNGPVAEQWMAIAQAYAGPAGTGRALRNDGSGSVAKTDSIGGTNERRGPDPATPRQR